MFVVEAHKFRRSSPVTQEHTPSIVVFCIATPFCLVSASGLPQRPDCRRLGVLQMGLSQVCRPISVPQIFYCIKLCNAHGLGFDQHLSCELHFSSWSVVQLRELRLSRLRHSPNIDISKLVSQGLGTSFNAQRWVEDTVSSVYANIIHI
jgi:hypothetical protein